MQGRDFWYDILRGASTFGCVFFYGESSYIRDIQRGYDGEEDEDSRTEIIHSESEIGTMVDFLKANPFVSMEDYKWGLSVPMIKIMSMDNTHIHYLSEKQAQRKNATVINNAEDLLNDLGGGIDFSQFKK